MRRKLVAGNWKMNGSLKGNSELLQAIKAGAEGLQAQIAVCVPSIFIPQVAGLLADSPIAWGGQNLSQHAAGAYTGEISAAMLNEFQCRYVIVGHSERRSLYGESDEQVAQKYRAARTAGLTPILCIGETLAEREAGVTESVVSRQLDAVIDLEGVAALQAGVIAYEPVWAIGTGKTASPEQAQAVHAAIRHKLAALDGTTAAAVQILYGGSMNASNAAELLAQPDIDGGLIGGAALKAADFLTICRAAG
jgi:triosephosphate isomerase (TIM)